MGVPELVWEGGAPGGAALAESVRPGRGGFDVLELGRGPALAQATDMVIPGPASGFDLAGGLMGLLSDGISGLGTIIGAPLGVIGDAASFVIDGIAGLVGKIPIVGELVGTVLLVGKTLLNAGLSLPETVLKAFANVLGSFSKLSSDQQKKVSEAAIGKLTSWGKEKGREEDVRSMLERNAPLPGGATSAPPDASWGTALVGIGVPVVLTGGAALFA